MPSQIKPAQPKFKYVVVFDTPDGREQSRPLDSVGEARSFKRRVELYATGIRIMMGGPGGMEVR